MESRLALSIQLPVTETLILVIRLADRQAPLIHLPVAEPRISEKRTDSRLVLATRRPVPAPPISETRLEDRLVLPIQRQVAAPPIFEIRKEGRLAPHIVPILADPILPVTNVKASLETAAQFALLLAIELGRVDRLDVMFHRGSLRSCWPFW